MVWYKSISGTELFFILAFIIAYGIYIVRLIYINRILKTDTKKIIYKAALRTLYFSLFIIALLGPSFGDTSKEIKSVGKDIMICVDLSESMNAFDIPPTRLEKVKFELKKIVEAFNSDRIGLIIFSSEAFMQCPLTLDQSALNLFIETLSSRLVPSTGTNFGPPLKMALEKLSSAESTVVEQKSKVILLISDGEDFGDETSSIISDIENLNIKLFTLGIGSEGGSKIKTNSGFKTDRSGKEIITQLNSKSLKSLAASTGGKYFEINESQNEVSKLINTISTIEGELRDAKRIDVSANKYFYFLGLGLILMLIDLMFLLKVVKV